MGGPNEHIVSRVRSLKQSQGEGGSAHAPGKDECVGVGPLAMVMRMKKEQGNKGKVPSFVASAALHPSPAVQLYGRVQLGRGVTGQ